MKCGQATCEREAGAYGFQWPGQKPLAACTLCCLRAAQIARHFGFTLATIPIEQIELEAALETVDMLKGADL